MFLWPLDVPTPALVCVHFLEFGFNSSCIPKKKSLCPCFHLPCSKHGCVFLCNCVVHLASGFTSAAIWPTYDISHGFWDRFLVSWQEFRPNGSTFNKGYVYEIWRPPWNCTVSSVLLTGVVWMICSYRLVCLLCQEVGNPYPAVIIEVYSYGAALEG